MTTIEETFTIRSATPADAAELGRICYAAFSDINDRHGFPCDFPNEGVAAGLMEFVIPFPYAESVVVERDGKIAGSSFLWTDSEIFGVGPVTVDPAVQNGSVGRKLMEHHLEQASQRNAKGVRLCQAAFHGRSMALYAKLGFVVREPLVCLTGDPLNLTLPGRTTRAGTEADLAAANDLCRRVHGFERAGQIHGALAQGAFQVVEHEGRLTGYTTGVVFFGHTVGESNEDVMALIGAAPAFGHPGFLLPSRNADLFRWCLENGLKIVQPMTLMTLGYWSEPSGAWLPSILY